MLYFLGLNLFLQKQINHPYSSPWSIGSQDVKASDWRKIMAEEMKNEKNGKMEALAFISSINAIPGVDLTAVTREVASKSNPGEKESFLPLIWKKAWAREIYPLHRCHAELREIKDGVVAAYAAFYIDNDPEKMPIGEGFAFVPIDSFAPDQQMARADAISMALGSAKSHAYTDAGFGLQFFTDDCIDDLQAAAISQMTANGGVKTPVPAQTSGKESSAEEALTGTAPVVSQGTSLADMVGATDVPTAPVEAPQRTRKSQYEVAKSENEEIIGLADQLVAAVKCHVSSSIGSMEHDAAQKSIESIHDKWRKLADDISSKMQKPSVQEAKAADEGYAFFAKTYEQVYAKDAARTEKAASFEIPTQPELEVISVAEEVTDPISDVSEVKDTEEKDEVPSLPVIATEETPLSDMGTQTTVFVPSVEDARKVVSTCGSYNGKMIGELYDNPVTKQILPKIFERSEIMEEKLAIKIIIENDEGLMAYCERNGKDLSL
jgi:hypothetical protein